MGICIFCTLFKEKEFLSLGTEYNFLKNGQMLSFNWSKVLLFQPKLVVLHCVQKWTYLHNYKQHKELKPFNFLKKRLSQHWLRMSPFILRLGHEPSTMVLSLAETLCGLQHAIEITGHPHVSTLIRKQILEISVILETRTEKNGLFIAVL